MKNKMVLIFDLGGVLLNLDQQKTINAFAKLGLNISDLNDSGSIFTDFEMGKIKELDFKQTLSTLAKVTLTYEQIDAAWNSMLLDITEDTLQLLEQLQLTYTIYLLSNTNSIHIHFIQNFIEHKFTWQRWCSIFENQFYSYKMGMRKPNKNIFEYVLTSIHKSANQCIFIDDNSDNIQTAAAIGIKTIHANNILNSKMISLIHKMANAHT